MHGLCEYLKVFRTDRLAIALSSRALQRDRSSGQLRVEGWLPAQPRSAAAVDDAGHSPRVARSGVEWNAARARRRMRVGSRRLQLLLSPTCDGADWRACCAWWSMVFLGRASGVSATRVGRMGGRLLRRWKLAKLHDSSVPIWAIGKFAVDQYRREFGPRRLISTCRTFLTSNGFAVRPLTQIGACFCSADR